MNVTEDEAELFRRQLTGNIANDPVKLLGIRGWAPTDDQANDLGIYDDLIVRFIDDDVTAFVASVDPGWYWIEHPEQEGQKYCAQLVEGIHKFKLGMHMNSFPALVQAENFHIHRIDKQGKVVLTECGEFGIHLHSGGPGTDVGVFSAGCQVIQADQYFQAQWLEFFEPLRDAIDDHGMEFVRYKLMDRQDMVQDE